MSWIFVYFAAIIVLSGLALLGRILYVLSKKDGNYAERSQPAKTLIILGSGGHTTEMLQIVRHLSFQRYSPRIYIHAETDKISVGKIDEVELGNDDHRVAKISRSREVGQSYLTSVLSTLVSFGDSIKIVWNEMPDLILCNGPGTCVPICVAAFILRLGFVKEMKIIFIESFCRVKTYSLTGKILYHIADSVIVQWPQLCKISDKHVHMIK